MEQENNTEHIPNIQICTIKVAFPVISDEEAIDIKQKLAAILIPIPKARIDLNLLSVPTNPLPKEE